MCLHISISVCMYIRLHMHIYIYICVCVCRCACVCVPIGRSLFIYIYIYIYVSRDGCLSMHMLIYMCIYVYVYRCRSRYRPAYMYVCIYITNIIYIKHTYKHTYTCLRLLVASRVLCASGPRPSSAAWGWGNRRLLDLWVFWLDFPFVCRSCWAGCFWSDRGRAAKWAGHRAPRRAVESRAAMPDRRRFLT